MSLLDFHYFADAKRALYDEEYQQLLPLMKKAGVDTLWMLVYNAGKYLAEKEEILRAKAALEKKRISGTRHFPAGWASGQFSESGG